MTLSCIYQYHRILYFRLAPWPVWPTILQRHTPVCHPLVEFGYMSLLEFHVVCPKGLIHLRPQLVPPKAESKIGHEVFLVGFIAHNVSLSAVMILLTTFYSILKLWLPIFLTINSRWPSGVALGVRRRLTFSLAFATYSVLGWRIPIGLHLTLYPASPSCRNCTFKGFATCSCFPLRFPSWQPYVPSTGLLVEQWAKLFSYPTGVISCS